jgi:hypothetical protein
MGWNPVFVQQLDWRPYAGQTVLVGELMHPDGQRRPAYVLGVVRLEATNLPEAVKAMIVDDAADHNPQAMSGELWAVFVNTLGGVDEVAAVLVWDDRGRLRYGHEALEAITRSGLEAPTWQVRGVPFDG